MEEIRESVRNNLKESLMNVGEDTFDERVQKIVDSSLADFCENKLKTILEDYDLKKDREKSDSDIYQNIQNNFNIYLDTFDSTGKSINQIWESINDFTTNPKSKFGIANNRAYYSILIIQQAKESLSLLNHIASFTANRVNLTPEEKQDFEKSFSSLNEYISVISQLLKDVP